MTTETIETGYYGQPGKPASRVHIAVNGAPACGTNVTGHFQWCAAGIMPTYVECERCKAWDRARRHAGHKPKQQERPSGIAPNDPAYRRWLRKRGNQKRLLDTVERITGRRMAVSTPSRWATGEMQPDACAEALMAILADPNIIDRPESR